MKGDGNWFSYPERIEHVGWKNVWERKIMMNRNSFVAFSTPKKTSIVKHVFSCRVKCPVKKIDLQKLDNL